MFLLFYSVFLIIIDRHVYKLACMDHNINSVFL